MWIPVNKRLSLYRQYAYGVACFGFMYGLAPMCYFVEGYVYYFCDFENPNDTGVTLAVLISNVC